MNVSVKIGVKSVPERTVIHLDVEGRKAVVVFRNDPEKTVEVDIPQDEPAT